MHQLDSTAEALQQAGNPILIFLKYVAPRIVARMNIG
jgi:hypothetical protein